MCALASTTVTAACVTAWLIADSGSYPEPSVFYVAGIVTLGLPVIGIALAALERRHRRGRLPNVALTASPAVLLLEVVAVIILSSGAS